MLFFYIYLFSILALGSFYVGPYTMRVYMTVLMLVYLLFQNLITRRASDKPNFKLPGRFMKIYFLFIVFTALALLLNGEYIESEFTKLILANYLNCFVTFFAINHFITDSKKLNQVIWVLLFIISIDAIITILQFVGNPIGKAISIAFTTVSDVKTGIIDDQGVNSALLLGDSIPMGIFGYVFTNCTYLTTMGILSLGIMLSEKNIILKYGALAVLLICLYAAYATQERMAFFMYVLVALYLLYTGFEKKRKKILLLVTIVLIGLFVLPSLMDSEKLGRLATVDVKEDVRGEIWMTALRFLGENLILGGPVSYSKVTSIAPHNFFLNVFIDSGLIGGLIVIYLYIIMAVQAIKELISRHSIIIRALAGSICIYSAVCLFHNASIATGDSIIFIFYALFLKARLIESPKRKTSVYENSLLYR